MLTSTFETLSFWNLWNSYHLEMTETFVLFHVPFDVVQLNIIVY